MVPRGKTVRRSLSSVLVVLGAAVALTGCSFHVAAGTDGHQNGDDVFATHAAFEKLVARSLAKAVDNGVTPTIDCGDDDIRLRNGRVQQCELSVPDDPGTTYDVAVTISRVKAYDDYHISAQVAQDPN